MNKVALTGRLTKDPNVRYSQDQKCVARFTLAVNRRIRTENGQNADFIPCVAFGKTGEFVEKYAKKGMKFDLCGRIQTGSYENKDGQKVYTTEVIVDDMEFGESKQDAKPEITEEFMDVADDADLPFN